MTEDYFCKNQESRNHRITGKRKRQGLAGYAGMKRSGELFVAKQTNKQTRVVEGYLLDAALG